MYKPHIFPETCKRLLPIVLYYGNTYFRKEKTDIPGSIKKNLRVAKNMPPKKFQSGLKA